jgi:DNA-binding transcriptional LysR family regulator
MDFERWKLFLKVAEMGSLSKVAVVMKRRQPVISRHINALEVECGCAVYRTGRGVALTEVGGQSCRACRRWCADPNRS